MYCLCIISVILTNSICAPKFPKTWAGVCTYYVCDCLCLPEQHQVVLLVHDDGAWGVLLALEGGGAQKGLSAMPHSWAKSQKTSKNGIFKKPLNWRVILIPATVWQILNMKLMNDRKRKSSKSAETCLEKFVKSHQVNLIFGGFQPFENTVYRVVVAARRRRRWQPPGHWPSSPAAVPS